MADMVDQQGCARPLVMTGNRVGLALMRAEDVATIARWNQDLEFTALLGAPGEAHTLEDRQELFKRNSRIKADSAEFSVVELSTGRLAGFGGLFDITRAMVATMFVGIRERDLRGRGLGSEAGRLICKYGFFFRNLHCIKVEIHAYNPAAIRMYERLGFKHAGRLRGANLLNGRRHDEVVMDLLREELELKYVVRFQDLERAGALGIFAMGVQHACRFHRARHHGCQHGSQPAEGGPRTRRQRLEPCFRRAACRARCDVGRHADGGG
jgi:RimJ/RimL family protein N-acetyltransferase